MRTLLLAGLVVATTLGGCTGAYRIRPIRLDESAALTIAVDPLLRALGLGNCRLAVTLNDVQGRALEVRPGPAPDFCLGFSVTSGALALPPDELRALIAHGLAHVQLGHATIVRVGSGSYARARGFTQGRLYSPAEEADADREAARLLAAAAPGGPGCRALGDVLARVGAERDRWGEWTVQHPVPPARVSAARALCTGAG